MNKFMIILGIVVMSVMGQTSPCGVNVTTNSAIYVYDLLPLYHALGLEDTLSTKLTDGSSVFVNICGTTTTYCYPKQAVCGRTTLYYSMGFGTVESQKFGPLTLAGHSEDEGVTVLYSGGYGCDDGNQRYATVHILCDQSAGSSIISEATMNDDMCGITMTIRSPAGCPTIIKTGGASVGTLVVMWIIIIGTILYLAGFSIYNYKWKEGRTFAEVFPHYEFWFVTLPDLVVEGCRFIKEKALGLCGKN